MIPLVAAIRVGERRWAWIPIPLAVIWLVLLPLCLLLLPVFVIACRTQQVPAGRALLAIWGVLRGLAGTRLEVKESSVHLRVVLI